MAESEAETPSTPGEFESKYFEFHGVRLPPFCRGKMEEIANFPVRPSDVWIVTYPKSGEPRAGRAADVRRARVDPAPALRASRPCMGGSGWGARPRRVHTVLGTQQGRARVGPQVEKRRPETFGGVLGSRLDSGPWKWSRFGKRCQE
ncbi:Sulfotransferase 4A1 [Tupaia chinensis]|uniref:Sulfotransferase 4A1 n=1 Tax=Tupaia chinensis TaxID=246437 RepID=L9KP41_TUPCH|nr:Sulfotransferase 4A1 [Tupaia chinensis]